ncbi:MAG: glycosyltransferase [Methylococcaceae bacterium]|nr:glycosyltransferase [Methylococcaceae bacterium]
MNIAIFSDCYLPIKNGVVTSIVQLKAGLVARGHRVIVFTAEARSYRETDPDVIRFRSVPIGLGTELAFARVDQARVNRIIRSENIQLIHSHTEFNLCLSAIRAARKFNLPRVQTNHTLWEEYTHYILNGRLVTAPLVRFFARRLFRGCAGLVAPSIKSAHYYGSLLPGIPLRVIPNGMERDRFGNREYSGPVRAEIRLGLGIDPGDRVMLFVGRIGREKRVLELLQALVPVLRSRTGIRMIFAGDGPELNQLRSRVTALNLAKQVISTGYVDWDSIGAIYAIADLFVTASLSEVHPMTVLEALMCSLPVIARKDDSYLDSVQPGFNGYLLDSDAGFGEKVLELLDDPETLQRLGEASRRIADQFTGRRHALAMEEFYRDVLDRFETATAPNAPARGAK